MFPVSYFPQSYFCIRYFPPGGSAPFNIDITQFYFKQNSAVLINYNNNDSIGFMFKEDSLTQTDCTNSNVTGFNTRDFSTD